MPPFLLFLFLLPLGFISLSCFSWAGARDDGVGKRDQLTRDECIREIELRDCPNIGAVWKNKKSGRPDEAISNRGPKSIGVRSITNRLIVANLISLELIDRGSMDRGPIDESLIVRGGAIGG